MNADQMLTEIREANISYLMLAQNLIRDDREQAKFRLGVSEETLDLVALLTPAQMLRIAGCNTLLCRMRVDDDLVWTLLTSHGRPGKDAAAAQLQADAILATGRRQAA